MPNAVIVWQVEDELDPLAMRLVYANPAASAVLGVPIEPLLGMPMREAFPGESGDGRPRVFLDVAISGEMRDLGEFTYGDDNVRERRFTARAFPLPHRHVGIAFDEVTAVREAEARVVETLESMSDAFFLLDRDWRFVYANPQTQPLLQRGREELVGRNIWVEFPQATTFEHHYRRAVDEKVEVEFEEYYPPLRRWFAVRAYPSDNGLAVYFHDITVRRELELQLQHSQKLHALGQLAGEVAHDFNNLLTVISGYTELALGSPQGGQLREELDEVLKASARAQALTRKLLAFARRQVMEVATVDLNAVVRETRGLLEPLIGEQIELRFDLEDSLAPVRADPAQLSQVLINLALNARDAMAEGGTLEIATRCVIQTEGVSGAEAVPPGEYVVLAVTDTGQGMDAATKARLFEPFFTTKPAGAGTGLGLSTVYGIVSQSAGYITCDTRPGAGTTFEVYLPKSEHDL